MENKVITVTSPLLPSLDDFIPYLQDIWNRKWLTNNGYYHQELEKALCEYLKVPYISLFTNGTLPLMCALQALRITGEVITTPYSFVATTHALWWNGIKPVFVDIDPETCNIDPDKIEAAMTPKTTAITPVHVTFASIGICLRVKREIMYETIRTHVSINCLLRCVNVVCDWLSVSM